MIDHVRSSSPTITVITVVRNGRELLPDTIQSVLNQSYRALDYVIIDGASTDGTVDIIRANADRLAGWLSEPDKGIADAFNKGVRMAQGDYLLFLNADDRLSGATVIEVMANAIVANDWPMLAFGDCLMVSRDKDEPLYRLRRTKMGFAMAWGDTLPHPALFLHRSYFEKYGLYDTSFRIAMDYDLLLRGAPRERIVHVPQLVSLMREGGISALDRQAVVDESIRALCKNGFIRTPLGEWRMRAYYAARLSAKNTLRRLGLYERLFRLPRGSATPRA